ncbi:serpin-ZX [Trifolium repens]|nr:serpin-ZX [Trifolium repens]
MERTKQILERSDFGENAILRDEECSSPNPPINSNPYPLIPYSLSLQPSFKQLITSDFKASFASVDFVNKHDEARKEVNLWVENKTKGIIKDILSPGMVHSLTRLIFANALYFKGAWKQEFDISKTKDYDFHLLNGSSVEVPFMTSKDDQFISSFDGFKVLRLPYKQGKDTRQFSIYIFLPDAKDGLLALIDKVTSNAEFLEDMLPYEKVEVGRFRIPKFNFSFGVDASELLKELGLVLPFEMGGLTKMVDSSISEELFVSDIIQKSFIEINEEGTTAAAATILAACGCSMYTQIPTLIDFVADHPFLFMIRDDFSGTILFTGQVLNPLAKE